LRNKCVEMGRQEHDGKSPHLPLPLYFRAETFIPLRRCAWITMAPFPRNHCCWRWCQEHPQVPVCSLPASIAFQSTRAQGRKIEILLCFIICIHEKQAWCTIPNTFLFLFSFQ
jgi:hypothetical protein